MLVKTQLIRFIIPCFIILTGMVSSKTEKSSKKESLKLNLCDRAKWDAKKSFEKGNITFTTYGLDLSVFKKKYQYKDILDSVLLNDYKIKIKKGGCVIDDYIRCYEKEIRRLVKVKYGENYLTFAQSKAVDIYSKTKEYQTQVLPMLKKDTIFKTIEPLEVEKRIERTKVITQFLENSNLNTEIKKLKISFKYILFKNGEIKIVNFYSPQNQEQQEKIKFTLKRLPRLKPAYFFAEPVRTFNHYSSKY